jgi:hypothetical protein
MSEDQITALTRGWRPLVLLALAGSTCGIASVLSLDAAERYGWNAALSPWLAHPVPAGLPRAQEHPAHRPLHRVGTNPVQRFLAGLSATGEAKGVTLAANPGPGAWAADSVAANTSPAAMTMAEYFMERLWVAERADKSIREEGRRRLV